ncbi:MAG TPA: methylthioribulose 1-phosphate dehydratase [Candidatus Acidoferrales bacterium]|jgi:methylthioribulose-1-phosphate dehydratase|nr:methylthioribulose 1-phosphate dehydratase [Candidatus Acidoferrales bacterium]
MSRPKRTRRAASAPTKAKDTARFRELARSLSEAGRNFYARGWVLGTSGNFSAVLSADPIRLAITSTGLDKSALDPSQFLEIDEHAKVIRGGARPSAEAHLHVAIVRERRAGAILHTHSVWSTIVSEAFAAERGLCLEGFEMLKGLSGVSSHEHREWLPVIENSQDMPRLAETLTATLQKHPALHGVLFRRHGLYTWGKDLAEARRHVEILEFLMEVIGRSRATAR